MNKNIADSNELTMLNHIKRLARGIKMVLDFMKIQPIDNVIAELNTLNTFVKVKGNSFDIGKTLFSFVEFDKNIKKLQKSVDCYMGMEESLIFCHDILSGKLPKLAAKEKAKGEQYPKAVWHSPLGGVNEQKARERKLRSDGKAISRSFNIAPGSKADFVLTVTQGAGKSQPNGIITPEGKPEVIIRVACSADNLKGLALSLKAHIEAYYAARYATNGYARAPKEVRQEQRAS